MTDTTEIRVDEDGHCTVCRAPHTARLHATVLGLRKWLRARLSLATRPIKPSSPPKGKREHEWRGRLISL